MMTPREVVKRTVRFQGADRLVRNFPDPWGSDFAGVGMSPSVDARPKSGADEWGCVWENIGLCNLGEVKEYPLREWSDWGKLRIPDIRAAERWQNLAGARERAADKFLMAYGVSLYERVHFLRGLENTWCDIYENPAELRRLIGVLVDMNLHAIDRYAGVSADGYMWCDDWGLQDRFMISPDAWREFWKPAYARVYRAAHDAGMLTFLHSCGHITAVLEDFIEIGLDCIQMDQQENMGLDYLGQIFGGRIAFWCPVDIQNTMARGRPEEIRAYCRRLIDTLGRSTGGLLPKWYGDPVGAGHTPLAVETMCQEFLRLSEEIYGAPARG